MVQTVVQPHLTHRWSGWPGAWCLHCGASDAHELCLADHDYLLTCSCGQFMCPKAFPRDISKKVEQPGHQASLSCVYHPIYVCPVWDGRDPYSY